MKNLTKETPISPLEQRNENVKSCALFIRHPPPNTYIHVPQKNLRIHIASNFYAMDGTEQAPQTPNRSRYLPLGQIIIVEESRPKIMTTSTGWYQPLLRS